jgi:hypothetical protein
VAARAPRTGGHLHPQLLFAVLAFGGCSTVIREDVLRCDQGQMDALQRQNEYVTPDDRKTLEAILKSESFVGPWSAFSNVDLTVVQCAGSAGLKNEGKRIEISGPALKAMLSAGGNEKDRDVRIAFALAHEVGHSVVGCRPECEPLACELAADAFAADLFRNTTESGWLARQGVTEGRREFERAVALDVGRGPDAGGTPLDEAESCLGELERDERFFALVANELVNPGPFIAPDGEQSRRELFLQWRATRDDGSRLSSCKAAVEQARAAADSPNRLACVEKRFATLAGRLDAPTDAPDETVSGAFQVPGVRWTGSADLMTAASGALEIAHVESDHLWMHGTAVDLGGYWGEMGTTGAVGIRASASDLRSPTAMIERQRFKTEIGLQQMADAGSYFGVGGLAYLGWIHDREMGRSSDDAAIELGALFDGRLTSRVHLGLGFTVWAAFGAHGFIHGDSSSSGITLFIQPAIHWGTVNH